MKQKYKTRYERLGFNIAYYRRLKKYKQWQVCELIDIDSAYLSTIESGKVGVSLDVLFALSDALEVPINKFFEFRE